MADRADRCRRTPRHPGLGRGHGRRRPGYGPGRLSGLHEVVSLALRSRIVGHDPCLGVKLPRVDRREMLFLSAAQVTLLADRLETAWPGHGWGLLVRFTAYSG